MVTSRRSGVNRLCWIILRFPWSACIVFASGMSEVTDWCHRVEAEITFRLMAQ